MLARLTAFRRLSLASTAALALAVPATAVAQTEIYTLDIPAHPLADALRIIAGTTHKQIIFRGDDVRGKVSVPVRGTYPIETALAEMLRGSGLIATQTKRKIIVVRPGPQAARPTTDRANGAAMAGADPVPEPDIVVTGSLIAGARSPSPTTVLTQRQIRNSGQNTLADAIRVLPQASGAGQNPGIGQNVPDSVGSNLGGASSINLRGLGSDATLTLLNGHRLAFNSAFQAVDISAIPLAAVDRVEIVTDGASALYGSDAVAGVANIILKKSYQGLETTARWGASTDGGNEQQQYSAVAGAVWSSGGLIVTYDFERDTPILARERSYATERSPGLTLYPSLKHHSATLSAHQDLAPGLTLQVDSLFNIRWTDRAYALSPAGDYLVEGNRTDYKTTAFTIAPSLSYRLSDAWEASFSGVYGEDRSTYNSADYTSGAVTNRIVSCYCNRNVGAELLIHGKVVDLPGGPLKIAFGGGYRKNYFNSRDLVAPSPQDISASQDDRYGFGELSLPVLSPENGVPLVHRLVLSAAARYEDYPRVGTVLTPKLGAIFSPSADIDFKGSWGKSFKAPTLYQLFSVRGASVYGIGVFGGSGYPAGTVGLYSGGGNPKLRPEKATNWTVTLSAHPRAIRGLTADITYFSVDYRDRIVTPVTYITQALSNPIYADLVTRDPSSAQIAAAIDGALFFNNSGASFDPSKVGAIIYSQYTNATHQRIQGIDANLQYRIDDGPLGSVTLSANASYIRGRQTLSDLQPEVQLAGTLFNPPHFRLRAGGSWENGRLTLSPFFSYIGGVDDEGAVMPYHVGSMKTVDLTARLGVGATSGLWKGIDVALSAQNIFNDKPASIQTTQVNQAPYDSANYSPWGRFVSLSISKSW